MKNPIGAKALSIITAVSVLFCTSCAGEGGANGSPQVNAAGMTALNANTGADASAAEVAGKNEVVYANLTAAGTVKEVYVVNIFDVKKAGSIVDYGDYSLVKNLTNLNPLTQGGQKIQTTADKGRFYYEGVSNNNELPWHVNISYILDGKEVPPEEAAGQEGHLEIQIKTEPNANADPAFFDNYLLQVSVTLNSGKCDNIVAEGGTKANAGENVMITFTVMPGKDGNLTVSADVTDFSMDGIQLSAVPMSMAMDDIDTDSMKDEMTELSDGVGELNDGVGDLYDGTGELADGVGDLKSGTRDLNKGTKKLEDGAWEFVDGAGELKDGTVALADGVAELWDGAKELADGTVELSDGTKELSDGAVELYDGAKELSDGVAELKDGTGELASGTKELYDGAKEMGDGVTELSDGTGKLADGSAELYDGSKELLDGANKLTSGVQELLDGVNELKTGGQKVADGSEEFRSGLWTFAYNSDKLVSGSAQIQAAMTQIAGGGGGMELPDMTAFAALPAGLAQIADGLDSLSGGLTQLNDVFAQAYGALDGAINAIPTTDVDVNAVMAAYGDDPEIQTLLAYYQGGKTVTGTYTQTKPAFDAIGSTIPTMTGTLDTLSATLRGIGDQISTGLASMGDLTDLTDLVAGLGTFAASYSEFHEGLVQYSEGAYKLARSYGELDDGVSQYVDGVKELYDGVAELKTGTSDYAEGVSTFSGGVKELSDGIVELDDGVREMSANIPEFVDGVEKLSDGAAELDGGVGELCDGTTEFVDGVKKLSDGIVELDDGVHELSDGAVKLSDGVGDLYDGVAELDDGVGTFYDGSQEFADGVTELSGGIADLDGGVEDLADGANKLHSGVFDLKDGTNELYVGVKEIPDELEAKIKEMMADYDKSGFVPTSFASPQNGAVDAVQFVLQTDKIALPKEEAPPTEETAKKETVWTRFVDLFKKK